MSKPQSILRQIPGLGNAKIAKLLAAFKTDEAVLAAHPSELRMWVSSEMARRIHEFAVAQLGADVPSSPDPMTDTSDADDYAAAV